MPRYRAKPVEIEAFMWVGDEVPINPPVWFREAINGGQAWLESARGGWNLGMRGPFAGHLGDWVVYPGDWIIRGVTGKLERCRPEIFELMYEEVEE